MQVVIMFRKPVQCFYRKLSGNFSRMLIVYLIYVLHPVENLHCLVKPSQMIASWSAMRLSERGQKFFRRIFKNGATLMYWLAATSLNISVHWIHSLMLLWLMLPAQERVCSEKTPEPYRNGVCKTYKCVQNDKKTYFLMFGAV